jgi:hypothetical protein
MNKTRRSKSKGEIFRIGDEVKVFWEVDSEWFYGKLKGFVPNSDSWIVKYHQDNQEKEEPTNEIVKANISLIAKLGMRVSRIRDADGTIIDGTVVEFHDDGETLNGIACKLWTIQYDDDPKANDTDDLEFDD